LILFLEPRSFVGPQSLFTNPAVLLQRLQSMIRDSLAVDENADADALASCSFAAILKISLHVQKFWDDFKYANVCSSLLRRIVLRDPSWQLRRRVVDHIKAVCADLHL